MGLVDAYRESLVEELVGHEVPVRDAARESCEHRCESEPKRDQRQFRPERQRSGMLSESTDAVTTRRPDLRTIGRGPWVFRCHQEKP